MTLLRRSRLPVGHCELNPIELIWAQVKGEVAKTNTGPFTMAAVQGHVQTALDHVTPDNWSKACDHVEGIERDFRQADGVMEDLQEAVVINIGADEAEESGSESESSESDSE